MINTIGQLVREHRIKCNKTQIEIAKEIGISRNYLSDIENDRYMPSVPVMVALSKRLGVDLNLLTKIPNHESQPGSWWWRYFGFRRSERRTAPP